MTQSEILEETIKFYSEDPSRVARSPTGKRCEYETMDGRHCAVGRCMTDMPALLSELKSGSDRVSFGVCYLRQNKYDLETLLKEEYKGHPIGFWQNLQHLHDKHDWKLPVTDAERAAVFHYD